MGAVVTVEAQEGDEALSPVQFFVPRDAVGSAAGCADVGVKDESGAWVDHWVNPASCATDQVEIWADVPSDNETTLRVVSGAGVPTPAPERLFDLFDEFDDFDTFDQTWHAVGDVVVDGTLSGETDAVAVSSRASTTGPGGGAFLRDTTLVLDTAPNDLLDRSCNFWVGTGQIQSLQSDVPSWDGTIGGWAWQFASTGLYWRTSSREVRVAEYVPLSAENSVRMEVARGGTLTIGDILIGETPKKADLDLGGSGVSMVIGACTIKLDRAFVRPTTLRVVTVEGSSTQTTTGDLGLLPGDPGCGCATGTPAHPSLLLGVLALRRRRR